jgi:RND family efflux transporter MFP subunit
MACTIRKGSLHSLLACLAALSSHFIPTLLFTLLGIAGCKHDKSEHPAEEVRIRPVLTVVAGNESGQSAGYSGKIEARYTTHLGFRLLGQIVSRQAKLGDTVTKGQLLATLDVTKQKVAVRNAEAALANAQAEKENAINTLKRQATLLQNSATSQANYDQAKRAEEAAKAAVVQAQSALDKADEVLEYAELRSDLDGVVTGVFAELGETVAAGEIVFSIADPGQREAMIDVDAEMLGSIDMASEFRVQVPPIPYECMGKVREIAPQADVKTRTTRIKIALDNPPESFRLGSTVKAFPVASQASQLRLPITAILERDGGTFVWVVNEPNNQVHLVAVTVSHHKGNHVVISDDIQPGDRVVIAGVHSLTDGQFVQVPTR